MKGITRYVKSSAKFLLACAMVCTYIPVSSMRILATDNQTTPDLKINFDEPVSEGTLIPGRSGGFNTTEENDRWQQLSLPIGNSRMGANVYGEISKEHLTFNQKHYGQADQVILAKITMVEMSQPLMECQWQTM